MPPLLRVALSLLALFTLFGILLLWDKNPDVTYTAVYATMVVLGFLMSVFYLLTWGFYAMRAWRHGRLKFGSITLLEFIIVPILAVPAFASGLYSMVTVGLPATDTVRLSRMLFGAALLLVVFLRNLNWVMRWYVKRNVPDDADEQLSPITPI